MKKLIVVAVLSVAAVVGWRAHDSAPQRSILKDRIWIDHIPRGERDMIDVFAVISRQPVGVFQKASAWQGAFEMFRYEASGDEMRLVFPQTGDREQLTIKARTCKDKGMDFCLDVTGSSRGVHHYYSREGWEIGSASDLQKKLATLAP
jgi:hypothetical protein